MTEPGLLSHQLKGEGETMLFLNGGMMTYHSWAPIIPAFSEDHGILICDFRGQLMSPGDPPRTFEEHAEDVIRLMDSLAIDRAHVIGASFGGEVGVLLAATHPERVRSLIAITAGDRTTPLLQEGSQRIREVCRTAIEGGDGGLLHDLLVDEAFSKEWSEAHNEALVARREQIASLPKAWFEGVMGLVDCLEKFDFRPHLDRIGCPTLVVIAGKDRIIEEERSRALAAGIARSKVVVFENSGHALVAEDPEGVAKVCREFLEELS
jgi:pimeloyl-ACP methyl ester carboxylesterase